MASLDTTQQTPLKENGSIENIDSTDAGSILAIITYSILALSIMFCNIIVMVTYWTERRVWQNISHLFILHLSIADFLVGLSIFPLTIPILAAGRWPFGELSCKIFSAFNYIVTFIPGLFILAVTTFRLFLVASFIRENVVKRKNVIGAIVALWADTLGIYLFLAFAWPSIAGFKVVDYETECLLEYIYHKQMSLVMVCFEFVIPFVLLLTMSFCLFLKIRQRSRGVRNTPWRITLSTNASPPLTRSPIPKEVRPQNLKRDQRLLSESSVQDLTPTKLQETDDPSLNPGTSDRNDLFEAKEKISQGKEKRDSPSKAAKYMCPKNPAITQSSKHGIPPVESNAIPNKSLNNRSNTKSEQVNEGATQTSGKDTIRGHRKAAVMLFAIVAAFVICWLPYVTLSLLFLVYPDIVSSSVFEAISGTLYLNSLINPALYGMTNVHFRRGFIRILHLPRRWLP